MTFDAAFDWARRHVAEERLPTAVLGITTAHETVALDAFGTSTDAVYPLFSITKALLGITAARTVERGLLTPNTPLADAVPEFGASRDDVVRLWHLASHTSGISEPPLDTSVPLRHELVTRGRDFAAGTVSRYSTLAFEGIAALVEHAAGHSWDDGTREWADAIGATGFTLDATRSVGVPDAEAGGLDLARFHATRAPGAGLLGTADDLLRTGRELLQIGAGKKDGILTPAGLAMMRRPLTGDIPRLDPYPAERGQDWGFTFNLRSRDRALIDADSYGHGGWAGAEFWVHPEAGVAWVLLTNAADRTGVDANELSNAIVSGR